MMLISALVLSSAVQAFADEETLQGIPLNEETAAAFLDEFFSSEYARQLYVGAAIAIVKDGEVIAERGYGYADAESGEPVDPSQTVFRVASVSKTFTALAIMQLVEQGKIDLNADILTYLPDLELDSPFDTPITVADLLTHQSGLQVRDPLTTDLHTDRDLYVSIEDYVRQHLPPVVREPGTAYMYDNFGYLLLGLIVQQVSGMPYEDYIQEHVFAPLGMTSSSYLLQGDLLERLITGYDATLQPIEPYVFTPTIMPHGGMVSTVQDMEKFMLAYLNGGALGEARILSEESVKEMSVYRSAIHPLLPNTTYGFEAASQLPLAGSSDAVITKLGDLPGSSSLLMFIPEQDVGVFLTYNLMQGGLRELFYAQFMSTFFPQYAAPAALEAYEPQSAAEIAKLAGYYRDLRLATLISKIDVAGDGSLVISDAFLGPRVLTQVDDDLFVDQIANRYTAFVLDEATNRAYMKEPYLNPLGYAQQGVQPVGFADVGPDNVYAPYIYAMQMLGFYDNDASAMFGPEQTVTRAELVYWLLAISGLTDVQLTDTELAFSDIADHPYAAYIQLAYQMGMVKGDGKGRFQPDRPATRQEAAVMIWNIYQLQYPLEVFDAIEVTDHADAWAADAVKMMVGLGLHGPEVTMTDTGAFNFRSRATLTRQEAAALYHQLMLQPVDLIITQLLQQQQAAEASLQEIAP